MTTQEIVKRFCDQCCWVKVVYNEYCILYESGKTMRHALLNEIAQNFFYQLQGILIDYLYLNICKLTDPPGCGKQKNLTVKYILERVDPQIQNELGLEELSERIHEFRNYIVDARRKLIAHLDVDAILSKKRLGAFPKTANEQFWADLQEFVNRIHRHYLDGIFPL
ncbi:MAG: AbiU2 domain-containing protein, partial [Planctomycetota bacterium]